MVIPGPSWSLNYNSEFEGEVGVVEEDTPWGSEAKVSIKDEDGKDEVMSFRWGAEDDGVEYIDIWDSASSEVLTKFDFGTWVRSVQFSPDGSKIVIRGGYNVEVCNQKIYTRFQICGANFDVIIRSEISGPARS